MRKSREGPAAWTAAIAAVIIIPVTVVGIWLASRQDTPLAPTPAAVGNGESERTREPSIGRATAAEVAPPAPGSCVRAAGSAIACGSAEALLVVMASPCDAEAVTRALGVDPREIELQIEARSINGVCAVAPTASAKAAGATTNDLAALPGGPMKSALLTCWTDLDPATAVPCNQAHRFEPVTAWRSLKSQRQVEEDCQAAAGAFVAGPVDQLNGHLSTRWVLTQEQEPRYRCVVASNTVLTGTVYRLGGRPLPGA